MIVCEDAGQVDKIASVRDNLPALEHVVVIDGPVAGVPTMDDVAEAGRQGDWSELTALARSGRSPTTPA